VFAVTLTNVIVFLPIVFIDAEIRLVFTEGAMAIVFPMLIAMLVALTLVPMASSRVLLMADRAQALRQRLARQPNGATALPFRQRLVPESLRRFWRRLPKPNMHFMRKWYSTILKSCLRHRVRFLLGIVILVLYTGFYTVGGIERDVMAQAEDSDQFFLFVYLPNGTAQDFTISVIEKVEDMLLAQVPEAKSIDSWVQEDFARIRINLKDLAERERESETIREDLRPFLQQFAEAEVTYNYTRTRGESQTPSVDTGAGGILEIRGPEYEQINMIAQNFSELLMQLPDIRDVVSETEEGPLELHFTLDRDTAAFLQITPQSVAQAVQVAQRDSDFSSIVMKKGDQEYDILFSQYLNPEDLENRVVQSNEGLHFDELKQVPIRSPLLGMTVPLEDLGTFKLKRGMGTVQRENRERIGRLHFDTATNTDYSKIETAINELINAYPMPAGYRMTLGGKSEQLNEELQAFKLMAWLAVILIYMSIAALFESYSQPLVIMLSIPLSILGIIWAMILTKTPFTPLSALGCTFLIGMLPNSPILLVHFANYLRQEKRFPRERAIMYSGYTRLRPIFMTVMTTVLGLLPMAIPQRGGDDWVPFAVPVIGGLLSSTVLTLVIVPGFYFIIEDVANFFSRIFRYVASWSWIFVFWSSRRRIRVRESLTAYRTLPIREEPLLVQLDHLTRIYPPKQLEQLPKKFRHILKPLYQPSPAMGFVPTTAQGVVDPSVSTRSRRKAVDMVSINIEAGLFGLLGPNGAGKTTLLRMIAGIDQPTRGYLSICGYDMKTEARQAQKLIGYLPQYFGVYSHMSAYHYLDYFALLKGIRRKAERRAAIMRALEMVNLVDQKDVPVSQFSGGMMRRIGLAQIFVQPPKVLIVDEPTVGLDPIERVRFRNLLSQLSQDRVVILSTHIVEDVAHSCRTMALMDMGRIQYAGAIERFVANVRGKVWDVLVDGESEWRRYRSKYKVAGQTQTAEGIRMRIINDYPPTPEADPVEPTLEDAYLYHIRERQLPDTSVLASDESHS
jgi:ABC-type multidrug transport system ATPase subunit